MKRIAAIFIAVLFLTPAVGFAQGVVVDQDGNPHAVTRGAGNVVIDQHGNAHIDTGNGVAYNPRAEQQRRQSQERQYQRQENRQYQQQRRQPGPSKVIEFDGDGYKSQYGD